MWFPVDFPLNQSIDMDALCTAAKDGACFVTVAAVSFRKPEASDERDDADDAHNSSGGTGDFVKVMDMGHGIAISYNR